MRRTTSLAWEGERFQHDLEKHRIPGSLAGECSRDVREILFYIHHRLFETDLNVNSLRSHFGLRNNNISTKFRQQVGLGIREYIEAQRMNVASLLLCRYDDIKVFIVAATVGYDNHETFCRAFQRFFRCPPSVHRARPLIPEWEEKFARENIKLPFAGSH